MRNLSFCFTLFIYLCSQEKQIIAIENELYSYKRPNTWAFITNISDDFRHIGKTAFKSTETNSWITTGVSTLLLIHYDQSIYTHISKFGRNIGIGNRDNTKTYIDIKGVSVFRGPNDIGSTLYFIGDGWSHILTSLSFYSAGLINDDYRAFQTASQIAQGMITVGFTTQLLKHITGRETPYKASIPRGKWRLFPNQIDYHKNVPKYDAFPSGHVATAMMTLTVISENYSEYTWIRPVGYSLLTLLGFQMINNGVHWASDYPLALSIGYYFGKQMVDKGRTRLSADQQTNKNNYSIRPFAHFDGLKGISFVYKF